MKKERGEGWEETVRHRQGKNSNISNKTTLSNTCMLQITWNVYRFSCNLYIKIGRNNSFNFFFWQIVSWLHSNWLICPSYLFFLVSLELCVIFPEIIDLCFFVLLSSKRGFIGRAQAPVRKPWPFTQWREKKWSWKCLHREFTIYFLKPLCFTNSNSFDENDTIIFITYFGFMFFPICAIVFVACAAVANNLKHFFINHQTFIL